MQRATRVCRTRFPQGPEAQSRSGPLVQHPLVWLRARGVGQPRRLGRPGESRGAADSSQSSALGPGRTAVQGDDPQPVGSRTHPGRRSRRPNRAPLATSSQACRGRAPRRSSAPTRASLREPRGPSGPGVSAITGRGEIKQGQPFSAPCACRARRSGCSPRPCGATCPWRWPGSRRSSGRRCPRSRRSTTRRRSRPTRRTR